jgi:hypothetical protein
VWGGPSPTQYPANKADFPAEMRKSGYRDLLTCAYPIHPELFQRLYDDWITLPNFQRTRGVLRLLAKTIEDLWESGSKDVMIMPSSMPLDDNKVKNELLRYLPNEWDSWVSYRPVAVFNAADLEGAALEGLIQKRRQAEGVIQRPEPERLAAAEWKAERSGSWMRSGPGR